jgi:hypothetical protein
MLGGIASLIALAGLAWSRSLWVDRLFLGFFAAIGLFTLASATLAVRRWGVVYRGWKPYPTYEEKDIARLEREIAEIKRTAARRDAIDETSHELKHQMEMLKREPQQEQLYGNLHERSKWDKWLTTLASEGLQREIVLGEKAHALLKRLAMRSVSVPRFRRGY